MDKKKKWFDGLPEPMKEMAKKVSDSIKEYNATFAEETPAASVDGQLKDGTPFKYTGDKLDKGSVVTVVTETGEVPMPDGEYPLPDESIMIVSGGTVTEVKAPEAMADDAKNLADVKERVTKIVEKFEAQFKAQENVILKQNTQIENLKLKQGKLAKDLSDTFSVVEAFGMIETDDEAESKGGTKPVTKFEKKVALIKTLNKK